MIRKSKLLTVLITALLAINAQAQNIYNESRPVITIKNGQLQGVETKGMLAFRNIPYATAPTGDLRWRPPQPAKDWSNIRDASKFGEACIQPLVKGLNSELVPGNEDCLKLNVYTPKSGKNLPIAYFTAS